VAALPIPTAADKLPVAKLQAPKDFKIEVYASGMTNARSLRIGDKGTVFVSSRVADKIYAITDKNGKREAKPLLTGLFRPNGIALHDGTLYIAELSQISKIDDVEDHLNDSPKPQVIYSDLPKDEPHGWKFLAVGPDNRLYFNVGAPCNICMPPDTHAQLRSIKLDGSDMQVVARGGRHPAGQAQPARQSRQGQFRLPLLPPGRHPRPGVRLGPQLRRVHQADRAPGAAQRAPGHALLYRPHVPERV